MNKAKLSLLLLVAADPSVYAQHPLEQQLAQLKPIAVVPLEGLEWPAGTLLCPLTPYQSSLSDAANTAQRVNAFLEEKQFQGDEGHWSLVVVKPVCIVHYAKKNKCLRIITWGE